MFILLCITEKHHCTVGVCDCNLGYVLHVNKNKKYELQQTYIFRVSCLINIFKEFSQPISGFPTLKNVAMCLKRICTSD